MLSTLWPQQPEHCPNPEPCCSPPIMEHRDRRVRLWKSRLPDEFCSQLNVPGAAGAEHRIGSNTQIRGKDRRSHRARNRQVGIHREHVEIGMIQDVEELAPNLHADAITQL